VAASQTIQKTFISTAWVTISIVAPFASQAGIIIEHAYVGALSAHAKLLRNSDRE
jgi:hypothetical protein